MPAFEFSEETREYVLEPFTTPAGGIMDRGRLALGVLVTAETIITAKGTDVALGVLIRGTERAKLDEIKHEAGIHGLVWDKPEARHNFLTGQTVPAFIPGLARGMYARDDVRGLFIGEQSAIEKRHNDMTEKHSRLRSI